MLPFRRVVFPVDYTANCDSAVPYVREMQQRFQSRLTLLRAFDQAGDIFDAFKPAEENGLPPLAELRKAEEDRLVEFAGKNFAAADQCVVQDGDPAAVIRDVVRHEGTDLVMMPTRGEGPFRRFLLGSVTAKVLHDLSCPVWTGTHFPEDYAPSVPYHSMMCVVNTGEEAMPLIRAAAAFADSYKARLSIVHVLAMPPAAWEFDYSPYRNALMASAGTQLRHILRELKIDAETEILEGHVAEAIRQYASDHRVDLVVAGRGHYQGLFGRLWSHLYSIVRESPCPVLSF